MIDFVMKLYELSFRQAVVRISLDFGLNLTDEPHSRKAQSAILEERRREAEKKAELDREYQKKAAEHLYWLEAKKYFEPVPGATVLHPLYAEALRRLPILEYWLDVRL